MEVEEGESGLLSDAVELTSGRIDFLIPRRTVLSRGDDYTLVNPRSTNARISLTEEAVTLDFSPALRFVIHPTVLAVPMGFLVEDVRWRTATYTFGGEVKVRLKRVPAWFAFETATDDVRVTVKQAIADLFAGLPFERPDYSPLSDPNLQSNVRRLRARIDGSSERDSSDTGSLQGLGVTVRLTQGFAESQGDARAELPAGTIIRIAGSCRPPSGPDGLIEITSATFSFEPELKIVSGRDVIRVGQFGMRAGGCRPTVHVDPGWVTFEKYGSGSGAAALTLGTLGLLGDLLAAGQGGRLTGENMAAGAHMVNDVAAKELSAQFTVAAGKVLERLKPQLRKEAPLIDWDKLFCDPSGRPGLARPLNR